MHGALEDNNSLILTYRSDWFDKAVVEIAVLMTERDTLKHSCSRHSWSLVSFPRSQSQ